MIKLSKNELSFKENELMRVSKTRNIPFFISSSGSYDDWLRKIGGCVMVLW